MKHIRIIRNRSIIFILLSVLVFLPEPAFAREVKDINKGWIIYNPYRPWTERASNSSNEKINRNMMVDLPHDFSIEGGFSKDNATGQSGGYLPGGKVLYRKNDIFIPEEWKGKEILVEFEGIYQNSTVYVNGIEIGFRPNGWVPIYYEISKWLKYGQNNMISVSVDNTLLPNCRWYSGSGIYRPVRLIAKDPLNIEHFGVYVTTPVIEDELAVINCRTTIVNNYKSPQRFNVIHEVKDKQDRIVASCISEFYLPASHRKEFEQTFILNDPVLWDIDNPELYTLHTKISQDDKVSDQTKTNFGVRDIKFTVDKGFFLNGKHTKLKGVCLHHDGGMTGSAVPSDVWKRRLEILKDMGCNAIRTSHNPFDPSFYDLCDQMGFLVMDEFLDEWTTYTLESVPYGSHLYWDDWHVRDLTDLIKRDRNHPSVIIWSAGNEIIEQAFPDGHLIAREIVDLFYSLDPTRPVTCGNNKQIEANMTGFTDEFDVAGYNYGPQFGNYETDREQYPYRKFIGTENTRGKSNRGVYVFPVSDNGSITQTDDNYYSSYDGLFRKYGQEHEWQVTEDHDYIAGMFIWTGIDYIGETSFPFPTKYADFAPLDVCCFPKDAFYFYRSVWNDDDITLHIFPHWNWPDRIGEMTPVWCYTNCDEVELYLNGISQGRKKLSEEEKLHLEWPEVVYQPGILKAIGYKNGKKVKEVELKTSGVPASITIEADRRSLNANGKDIVHITISTKDKDGNYVPDSDSSLDYNITGGKLIGIDNGDPQYVDSYKKLTDRKLFNGLALLMIQASDKAETIRVTVSGKGLEEATISIPVK